MQHVSGIVTVVQEGRFRLASDDGQSMLFTLHHGAPVEPQDLAALLGRGRVRVAYSAASGRNALVAHGLRMEGEG